MIERRKDNTLDLFFFNLGGAHYYSAGTTWLYTFLLYMAPRGLGLTDLTSVSVRFHLPPSVAHTAIGAVESLIKDENCHFDPILRVLAPGQSYFGPHEVVTFAHKSPLPVLISSS